jgi:hypothetical protein
MVFAVNCGADGTPNSFTNFKAAALQVGQSLSAAAAAASTTWTAAYGTATVPPPPVGQEVTQTITLESSTWATTFTSFPNSPSATPASLTGNVHKVIVGGPGTLMFNPANLTAQPRDIIMFELCVSSFSPQWFRIDSLVFFVAIKRTIAPPSPHSTILVVS